MVLPWVLGPEGVPWVLIGRPAPRFRVGGKVIPNTQDFSCPGVLEVLQQTPTPDLERAPPTTSKWDGDDGYSVGAMGELVSGGCAIH